MSIVKNIAVIAFAVSFMFAGVGFHSANHYTSMDEGTVVTASFGVSYDLNDNTSIGWDSNLGLLMVFDAPAGVSLRLGWTADNDDACSGADTTSDNPVDCADAGVNGGAGVWGGGNPAGTSIGLGYTWWSGGESFKTSISTNFDYMMKPEAGNYVDAFEDNATNLSVVVGFGF